MALQDKFYKQIFHFQEMVMKKIFEGNIDEEVHSAFLKFGRGEYKNKYMIEGKKQAKKWSIKTSAEYANLLVKMCLSEISSPIKIKGVIVSTSDLRDEIPFELKKISNFQGVRKHEMDTEIEPPQILELMDKYPRAFFALTFSGEDLILKIKPKAPTSGKPGKEKEDGPSVDFCSLKTSNKEIVDKIFFGVGEFTEAKINHTISINDIIYPSNMEELKPAEVREQAKRKGIIKREVKADGIIKTSEASFIA